MRQTPQGMVDNWPTVGDRRTLSGRQLSPAFRGADAGTCQEGLDNLTGEMTGGPENGTKVTEPKRGRKREGMGSSAEPRRKLRGPKKEKAQTWKWI